MKWGDDMEEAGYETEMELKKKMRDASPEEKKRLRNQLVKLYVRQAEYFKLSPEPNYKTARLYLEKALSLEKYNPVANYRLGYIEYVDQNWSKAIYHLNSGIDGTDLESISEVQETLAHMFLVNCGIELARESLAEIEFKELQFDSKNDEKLTYYRNTLKVQEEKVFERLYYRKIQQGRETILSEEAFHDYEADAKEIVLKSFEEGMAIFSPIVPSIPLRPNQFFTLYILLTQKQTTYTSLQAHLSELLGQHINYDNVRQLITRLKQQLPQFHDFIDSEVVRSGDGSRTIRFQPNSDWIVTVLCRADQFLKIT